MVFPHSFTAILLIAIASLLFGALWALTVKAAGKWRFELFGIDFGLGVVLGALLVALTFGTFGDEITVYDNLMIMRRSSVLFLAGFGAVLNLGMLLLLGAISLAGVAVAFLAGMSIAAVASAIGMNMVQPFTSPLFLGLGSILLLAAVAVVAGAYSARARQRDTDLVQRAVAAGIKGKVQRTSPAKGLILAIVGGLLIGLAQPIAIWTQGRDEIGFGAYSMAVLFAAAFAVGTPFFSLFFLNLPVQGEALPFGRWFQGTGKQHLMGLAGGFLWFVGLVTMLLTATVAPGSGLGRATAFSLSRSAILVGGVVGIFMNAEFGDSGDSRSRAVIGIGAAAAGLIAYAAGGL